MGGDTIPRALPWADLFGTLRGGGATVPESMVSAFGMRFQGLPRTGHQAPSTKNQEPRTKHQAPTTGHRAPGTVCWFFLSLDLIVRGIQGQKKTKTERWEQGDLRSGVSAGSGDPRRAGVGRPAPSRGGDPRRAGRPNKRGATCRVGAASCPIMVISRPSSGRCDA